jgi:hypothetical protein
MNGSELSGCPFCGSTNLRIVSNREYHKLMGHHESYCVFDDDYALMVPATVEALAEMVAGWNRRVTNLPAEAVAYADPMAFFNFKNGVGKKEWMWAKTDIGLMPLYTAPVGQVDAVKNALNQALTEAANIATKIGKKRGLESASREAVAFEIATAIRGRLNTEPQKESV